MASIPARLSKLMFRATIKRRGLSVDETVRHLRRTMNTPPPAWLPRGVSVHKETLGGVPADRVSVASPSRTILYLHGGAFTAGLPKTYHNLAGRLAKGLSAQVFVVDYRLAPEYPYPAPLDDCLAAYEALLERGVDPASLVIAGDSAGGNLTLSCLLSLRDRARPLPACAVGISPATDATASLPSVEDNDRKDAMLTADMIRAAATIYLNGTNPREPLASPSFGVYEGLPPLLLTVSESECLRDDCYAVVNKAREAGVEVDLISRPDMPHVWPIMVPLLPEARRDVKKMVAFIRERVAG